MAYRSANVRQRAHGRHWCALLAVASLLGACRESHPDAGAAAGPAPSASRSTPKAPRSELVVLAATSLKSAFEALEDDFEAKWQDVDVRFAFAGTQELRRQLEAGARADVFASADERHMQALVDQGLVEAPVVFTENVPVLVAYAHSKTPVTTFAGLAQAERIVLGVPEVPIGRYSLQILERAETKFGGGFKASVERHVVSKDFNVRQVLSKVTLGEADAAIVYHSDVTPPDRNVRVVTIPEDVNVTARYPVAMLKASTQPAHARAWIALLRSPVGRATLQSTGFRPTADDAHR